MLLVCYWNFYNKIIFLEYQINVSEHCFLGHSRLGARCPFDTQNLVEEGVFQKFGLGVNLMAWPQGLQNGATKEEDYFEVVEAMSKY